MNDKKTNAVIQAGGLGDHGAGTNEKSIAALAITRFENLTAPVGARVSIDGFDAIVRMLSTPIECPTLPPPPWDDEVLKAARRPMPGWSPATFEGNHRGKDRVERVAMLCLDHDDGSATIEGARELWQGTEGVIHTTTRHDPEHHRFRVGLRLSRPVTGAEYERLWSWAELRNKAAGYEIDDNAKDPSRFWFLPVQVPGFEAHPLLGAPLNVDSILAEKIDGPAPANDRAGHEGAPQPSYGSDPDESPELRKIGLDVRAVRARMWLAHAEPAISGSGGHATTMRTATAVVCGFAVGVERGVTLLRDYWNPTCKPPWKEHELRHKCQDAFREMRIPWGSKLLEPMKDKPGVAKAQPREPDAAPANDTAPAIEVVGVDEIFAPLPPMNWAIEAIRLAPGAPTILAGPTYTGKTMLAQALGLAIASGRRALDVWTPRRGRVVHVDGEQGRRITYERYQRMARAMGVTPDDLRDMLAVAPFPSVPLDAPSAREAYLRLLDGATFAILDSLRALAPTIDENSSFARAPLDMLSSVSEKTGCAIAVIDHTRKWKETDGDAPAADKLRGANAKGQALQSLFFFSGPKKGPIRVEHEKERVYGTGIDDFGFRIEDIARDGDPRWGLRLVHLDREQLSTAPAESGGAQEKQATRILGWLAAHGGAFGGNKGALQKEMGMQRTAFFAAFSTLEASGRVHVDGTKRTGPRISLISGVAA